LSLNNLLWKSSFYLHIFQTKSVKFWQRFGNRI